ncbi:MAG: hypothetical protein NXI12_01540 [Alphaproteobacteria bacterium]|nr:hypothetical protein [Alphaproteobacteria bacterium]
MTMNDDAMAVEAADDAAFDAELSAMFQEAAPPAEDPVFTAHVVSQLGRTDRTRLLALGGAGATGSAVAGSQLESLISGPLQHLDGVLGQAAGFMGPEAIVTGLFAALALGVAWIIPKGRLTAI